MNDIKKSGPGELLSIGNLFKTAWHSYKERKWTLLAMMLISALLPVLAMAPFVALGVFVSPFFPGMETLVFAGCVLLGAVGMIWIGNWSWSAFIITIADQRCHIKQAFRRAKPKILAHIWLGLLTGFILVGAHMLFIIPGILFTVWFFFAPFVFIEEDERGISALLKSKEYVRGRWFPVAIRLIAVWFLFVLMGCIPVLGQLLLLFLLPLSFVYTHLLYKNLKATRGETTFEPTRKDKTTVVAAGAMGLALPAVMVLLFMGSMTFMPFSMLKASLNNVSSLQNFNASDFKAPDFKAPGHEEAVKTKTTKTIRTPTVASVNSVDQDIQALKDLNQDWTIRSQAAFRLGQANDPKAVASLVEALKNDKQWAVRQNAINALQHLNARQTVADLILALESDENVFVRQAAALALGRLGDKQALPALEKALQDPGVVTQFENDKETEVKAVAQAAQEALKRFETAQTTQETAPAPTAPSTATPTPAPEPAVAAATTPMNPPEGKTTPENPVAANQPELLSGKDAQKYRDHIEACNKALKIEPSDGLAYHNRAVAYFRLGDYENAVKDFTSAIKYRPEDAGIYYNRAIAYGLFGNHQAAVADGVKAIEMDPNNAGAYVNRGIDYLAMGKMQEAVADLTKAISVNQNDAAAYYARGVAYQKIGSQKEANQDFLKASQLGNAKAKAYLQALQGKPNS